MVACAEAGADAVDAASDSMSGMTSQPSINAIIASLNGGDHDTGLNARNVRSLDTYWQQLRLVYSPFEAHLRKSWTLFLKVLSLTKSQLVLIPQYSKLTSLVIVGRTR